jgi:uncharacterized lipoprotein YbaY
MPEGTTVKARRPRKQATKATVTIKFTLPMDDEAAWARVGAALSGALTPEEQQAFASDLRRRIELEEAQQRVRTAPEIQP